jgi:pimeloyl-ACP methyl ester carboxylesterase
MPALATVRTGSGPPVLLVHGLNGFKEGWGPLPGAIAAAGMTAVGVDLPGFGATPPLRSGRHTSETLAAALGPLVEEIGPVGVVGHSFGGQVAVILAAAHPGKVGRLALLSPFAAPRPRRFPPRRVSDVLAMPVVGPTLARIAIARMRRDPERCRAALLGAVARPERLEHEPEMAALVDRAAAAIASADLSAMVQWASSGLVAEVRPLAPRVAGPALVVAGELDRVTPLATARALAGAFPDGRLMEVPDVAHFPHLEGAERVCAAVAAHLGGA